MVKNFFKHLALVLKHKWIVFKLCVRIGIPWQGLVHDLSKFSYDEFWESVKYFQGIHSPIPKAKKDKGYSLAWLHHKGRNKHHYQYWNDVEAPDTTPIIPYKYVAEMVCDQLAAGMVYNGKNWKQDEQLRYWEKNIKNKAINPKINNFLSYVYTKISEDGIKKTLTKKNLILWYDECVNGENNINTY